ncbi:hypothetical protein cyc_09318 [Cyclospora cayetanensis]|uniref:Uncharacterized protein n=1 Tax=Cyclospora cayetanensis TaxID=88456 RepID=A0A1D3D2F2_9EIME|nr:hypothetical protein cyc_09318 [Cyclospora cayetanensis]
MSVPNVMEVEGEEELLSDDDEDRNRSGAVPLWWYDKYKHIGTRLRSAMQRCSKCCISCNDMRYSTL